MLGWILIVAILLAVSEMGSRYELSSVLGRHVSTAEPCRPHSVIGCSGGFCKSCEELHSTQVREESRRRT